MDYGLAKTYRYRDICASRARTLVCNCSPFCFCTIGGLQFDGRQHRRLGEQQQEQQQPLLRPARSNRKHGKPVRSRFTATRGDSAQGRHFSLISMAASLSFFLTDLCLFGVFFASASISPFSSLSCKCNVLFPILASCRCLAHQHKDHNFQDAQLAPIGRRKHYSRAFMILLLPRSPIPTC